MTSQLSDVQTIQLTRSLAKDIYPVFMMGRGLGSMTSQSSTGPDLKSAEHDLERAASLGLAEPALMAASANTGKVQMPTSAPVANMPMPASTVASSAILISATRMPSIITSSIDHTSK